MRNLLFLILLAAFFGCQRLPNIQGRGNVELQGEWAQDSSLAISKKLLNYNLHQFKFTCDSFYVTITTHATANYYSDSCFNNGVWDEYAKGVYAIVKDTLVLEGTYTKENFKQKVSGCFNIGQYRQNFLIKSTEKKRLVLENIGNHMEAILDLTKPIICVPKSL